MLLVTDSWVVELAFRIITYCRTDWGLARTIDERQDMIRSNVLVVVRESTVSIHTIEHQREQMIRYNNKDVREQAEMKCGTR